MKFVWLRLALCSVVMLLMAPAASVTKTWSAAEILTAGDLNQNFTDVVNAANAIDDDNVSSSGDIDPTKLDAHQDTQGEAETHGSDPIEIATPTLAGTLAAEIQQIRFQLRAIADQDNDNWYESLLNVGFSTGDVKLSIKNSADAGWVMMDDQTIGDLGNNCTERSNADTVILYRLLWNNIVDVRTLTFTTSVIALQTAAVASISAASPAVVTTTADHNLVNGDVVTLAAVHTIPDVVNRPLTITVTGDTTFTVPVNTTEIHDGAGTYAVDNFQCTSCTRITTGAHNLGTGDRVAFAADIDTTPSIQSTTQVVTVLTATTFTVPVNTTVVADEVSVADSVILELVLSSAGAPVDKGADPNADFLAGDKCILLPRTLGRALAGADTAGGGTAPGQGTQVLGSVGGEHTNVLSEAQMPAHTHAQQEYDGGSGLADSSITTTVTDTTIAEFSSGLETAIAGSGASHNIRGPITYLSIMIKL